MSWTENVPSIEELKRFAGAVEQKTDITIEERAFASWKESYPEGSGLYKDAQIDGYIRGASEQKAIDINIALIAHCSVCEFYNECKERETLMQCGSCLFIKSKMEKYI